MEVLIDRIRVALALRAVTAKRMFGGLTFLLNGNMLCCVSEKGLMVRVGAAAEPAALEKLYAAPCLGAGRRMAGFILVEPKGVARDADLADWLDMALDYVGELPAKAPKSRQRSKSWRKSEALRG
jgi:TfoX/Sxy family transcriptional regulator of competence genes